MIELVVFDMAGTVIDEENVVYKSLHHSLLQAGYNIDFDTVLWYGAGKEKRQAISDLLFTITGVVDEVLTDTVFVAFKEQLLYQYANQEIKMQPGTEEVFDELRRRGIFITLNTGYDRFTAELLLEKLAWHEGADIDFLITASDVQHGRPAPDMILSAMHQFGLENPQSVMKVGDSVIDIEEGLNAHCRYTVGITTGAHTRSQLEKAGPSHIVDSLMEILQIIDESIVPNT
jgi:phosphonatase-like hydrolase